MEEEIPESADLQEVVPEEVVTDEEIVDGEKATISKKRSKKKNRGKSRKGSKNNVDLLDEPIPVDNEEYAEEEEEKNITMPDECLDELEYKTKARSLPEHYQTSHGGAMNIEWFSRIKLSKSLQKTMSYSESLLMVTESGQTVGKMYCSVSESEWTGVKCLCVHSGTSASFQSGLECGTTITGFVNARLRTLHEYIHEWAKIGDKMYERKTFLIQEAETMHCRVLVIKNKKVTEDRVFFLSKLECQNLITESGSILFQRVIIQEKKTGEIIVRTVTSKGVVVRCIYHYIGHGNELVKGENIKVYGIRRTVLEEGSPKTWDSLFNYFGRLILRCQPENENALVPLWFDAVITPEILDASYGSRPPLLWACDLELYAKYTTHRREKAGEYRTYLKDHPELRALLSDFLQAVLQQKPSNIIGFAANYFEPWLPFHDETSRADEPGAEILDIINRENMTGEDDYPGESSSYDTKGLYGLTPIMDEDNVLLEENNDFYLKELQKDSLYGDDPDQREMTTVYKNYAAFQKNEQLGL